MSYGGSARINGVTFQSDDVVVTARRVKGKIKVDDSGIFDEYEYVENEGFDIDYTISKIPFSRGLWALLRTIFRTVILFITLTVAYLLIFRDDVNNEVINIPYQLIISILIFGALLIRFTPLSKYHAAEHMVANCYDNNEKLNVKNALKQSRVYANCGTNFVSFIVIIFVLLIFIPVTKEINYFILYIMSWAIVYELIQIENELLKNY
ncbi:DUF1385 domain-containing protein [Peribacillus sp. NPDC096379]|uniref:DUF1385 domain-containing protein n=1 Tax=Peribacillus sp. NPDC096379 TaxID=3364393 RepID=UPI00380AE863